MPLKSFCNRSGMSTQVFSNPLGPLYQIQSEFPLLNDFPTGLRCGARTSRTNHTVNRKDNKCLIQIELK